MSKNTHGAGDHLGGRGAWVITNLEVPRDATPQPEPYSPRLIIRCCRRGDLDALPNIGGLLDLPPVVLNAWTSASGGRVVAGRAIAAVRDNLAARSMDAACLQPRVDIWLGDHAGAAVQDCREAWKEGDSGDGLCLHCELGF